MSSPYLAMSLEELQKALEAHQVQRPADVFSPEMAPWIVTKGKIAFAIELKEGEARTQPFTITVPPQSLSLSMPKPAKEVRHADSPGKAGAPGAPLRGKGFSRNRPTTTDLPPSENPVPQGQLMPTQKKVQTKEAKAAARRKYQREWRIKKVAARRVQSTSTVSPEEQLDTLLAKLSNATGECAIALDKPVFVAARKRAHQFRWQIGKLVKAEGLESPMLPPLPTNPWTKPQAKGLAKARKQSAPPQQLQPKAARLPEAFMPPEFPPARELPRCHCALPKGMTDSPSLDRQVPEAAARLRALRAQALEILPQFEGVSRDEAYAIRHQIDLLADVLAMGDRILREAV